MLPEKNAIAYSGAGGSCVLVGIALKHQSPDIIQDHLNELEFLALTFGLQTKKKFIQRLQKPDPSTFIGKGKVSEVAEFVRQNLIPYVIFDDELTPSQQRNLEKEIGCNILDRTQLILNIFEQRAQTAHAKTQVELARLQYLLPRLKGMWTHLERQRGGTGTRGGAGEKEIETDRRLVQNKITKLKHQLREIDQQMFQQRKQRGEMVRVALVGYTNAGKSSLMNFLSKSSVLAENKLFATLDATVRKVNFHGVPFLLSDTVGFIRKLPTLLIESFKSTLDEVRESDLLLHVVDISHPKFEEHMEVVRLTLQQIGAENIPIILVFNKIDIFPEVSPDPYNLLSAKESNAKTLELIQRSWIGKTQEDVVFISVLKKINTEELRRKMIEKIKKIYSIRYPYALPGK